MGLVKDLIGKDYHIEGNGKWLHTVEHDSLVINDEEDFWFWNSVGKCGNAFTWLTKIKGMSYEQAKEYLKTFPKYSDSFVHIINNGVEDVIYPKLVNIFYENGKQNPKDYWFNRGISERSIDLFQLGYYDGWYMVPIFMDGIFRNFQMRREFPKEIKGWYKGIGPLLFNSDLLRLTDKIVITEGPLDAIVLFQNGIPAVSHNAGSECFLPSWFKYFIGQREILICYDNDSAGRQGAKKVSKILGEVRCKIYTFEGFKDKYDPVDFYLDGGRTDEMKRLLNEQSKYLWELQ